MYYFGLLTHPGSESRRRVARSICYLPSAVDSCNSYNNFDLLLSPLGEALITKTSPLTFFYIFSVRFINSFFIWDMWCLPLGKKEAKFALLMQRTAARSMAPCQQFMQKTYSGEG